MINNCTLPYLNIRQHTAISELRPSLDHFIISHNDPLYRQVSLRNALLEGQLRGTFLIFLLQMAEANVEMHSANENEDQLLLMSDGANVPEQNPHAPPRDNEHEHRRIRRMNRREREEREIARNRRREQRERRSPERHHSGSHNRHRIQDWDRRRIQEDVVQGHREQHVPLRRSKLTCHRYSWNTSSTCFVYCRTVLSMWKNGAYKKRMQEHNEKASREESYSVHF